MSPAATLRAVSARDRSIALVLMAAAIVAWIAVAFVLTTVSPVR